METELGWEFIQLYGLTETSPVLTINRRRVEWDELSPADRATRLGRAGAPTLGVRLETSEDGEVLARSNVVFDGYWNQPDATAAALEDGWFHTGDGGTLDDDSEGRYLAISDRKKDVIISGGENVSSIEVEVVPVPDADVDEAALIAHCREHLAHFKCPTSVEMRDALPRTATGKLQKFKLRAPFWEGRVRQVN
jgi:acyl-CoA synthetase (AMP-forming)/AMP-acid ligase II